MGWSSGVGSAARRIALSHRYRWGPFVIRGEVTGPAATPGGSNGPRWLAGAGAKPPRGCAARPRPDFKKDLGWFFSLVI